MFESEQASQWTETLAIDDLDGDGRAELVVLAQDELLVYSRDEKKDLSGPRRHRLSDRDS